MQGGCAEIREASQSRAFDRPSSDEGRKPERPDQTENVFTLWILL